MIPIAGLNTTIALNPTAGTAGATLTSSVVDMKGFDYAIIEVEATTADVASNSPTVFKVQTCDTTVATSFADDAAFVGGGTGGFTIPASPTATTLKPYAVMAADWRARPRYFQVKYSPAITQTVSIRVLRFRADIWPINATDVNAAVFVTG